MRSRSRFDVHGLIDESHGSEHLEVQVEDDYLIITDDRVGSIPIDAAVFDRVVRELGYTRDDSTDEEPHVSISFGALDELLNAAVEKLDRDVSSGYIDSYDESPVAKAIDEGEEVLEEAQP